MRDDFLNVKTLFSVPLFTTEIRKSKIIKDTVVPVLKDLEKSDNKPYNYSVNSYTSYGSNKSILEKKELLELKSEIEQFIYKISNHIGINPSILFLSNSWFSINRRHCYHETHNHNPNIWSGVYYVQCQKEDSPIVFINNNLKNNWPYYTLSSLNETTSPVYRLSPKTGDLIVFPSYLEHAVEQQLTDNERITIAFNYDIKKC